MIDRTECPVIIDEDLYSGILIGAPVIPEELGRSEPPKIDVIRTFQDDLPLDIEIDEEML